MWVLVESATGTNVSSPRWDAPPTAVKSHGSQLDEVTGEPTVPFECSTRARTGRVTGGRRRTERGSTSSRPSRCGRRWRPSVINRLRRRTTTCAPRGTTPEGRPRPGRERCLRRCLRRRRAGRGRVRGATARSRRDHRRIPRELTEIAKGGDAAQSANRDKTAKLREAKNEIAALRRRVSELEGNERRLNSQPCDAEADATPPKPRRTTAGRRTARESWASQADANRG